MQGLRPEESSQITQAQNSLRKLQQKYTPAKILSKGRIEAARAEQEAHIVQRASADS